MHVIHCYYIHTDIKKKKKGGGRGGEEEEEEEKKNLQAAFPEYSHARDGSWAETFLQWFLSCPKKDGHVF